jgi:predicted ATPase
MGLNPYVLSHKLNENDAVLTAPDAVAVITALAEWGAITERAEARRMLALLDLPEHAVPESAWASGPLARLGADAPISAAAAEVAAVPHIRPEPVPAPLNALIGRADELRLVSAALCDARLVTLCGVGGTGKTRLAVEAAMRLSAGFRDGIAFADLSAVHDTALTAIVIARALRLSPTSVAAAENELRRAVAGAELLVVVDNVEQLPGVGVVLARLLASAPGMRFLVTSRVVLRVHGEHVVHVAPLALPGPGASPAAVRDAEAVQMFLQRARAAGELIESDEDLVAVAEICAAVDGLPLAIELAAARTPMFPPAELVRLLERRLELLTDAPADRPRRHQSLRAALDWSYGLLPAETAAFFARLGVFAGSFDAAAAAALSDPPLDPERAGQLLAELAAHSFLRVRPGPVFQMLHVVREYALDRLGTGEALVASRLHHLRYFTERIERLRPHFQLGGGVGGWVTGREELKRSFPEILAALRFAAASAAADAEIVELGLRLAAVSSWARGDVPIGELRLVLDQLLRHPSAGAVSPAVRAGALLAGTALANVAFDAPRVAALGAEAYSAYDALNDESGRADALAFIGEAELTAGDPAEAEDTFRRMLVAAQRCGNTRAEAAAYNLLAYSMLYQGRLDEAARAALQGIRITHLAGDVQQSFILSTLAEVASSNGEYRRAARILRRTLRVHTGYQDPRALAYDFEALAATLSRSGCGAEAFTLVGAAQRIRDEITAPLPAAARRLLEAGLRPAREACAPEAREQAEAAGRAMPVDDAVALALELTAAVRP